MTDITIGYSLLLSIYLNSIIGNILFIIMYNEFSKNIIKIMLCMICKICETLNIKDISFFLLWFLLFEIIWSAGFLSTRVKSHVTWITIGIIGFFIIQIFFLLLIYIINKSMSYPFPQICQIILFSNLTINKITNFSSNLFVYISAISGFLLIYLNIENSIEEIVIFLYIIFVGIRIIYDIRSLTR